MRQVVDEGRADSGPLQVLVGCGLSMMRLSAYFIPEKDNAKVVLQYAFKSRRTLKSKLTVKSLPTPDELNQFILTIGYVLKV